MRIKLELDGGIVRRAVFGVFVSMIIGGLGFSILFGDFFAIIISVYAFPFLICYGLPVAWMAHKLTKNDLAWPAAKRLLVYLVMGGWLPTIMGFIVHLAWGISDNLGVIIIILAMNFAFGYWLGEEIFERTKLRAWTEPNLMKV
ncbi:MAG: hypothetical protein ABWX61_04285 [Paenisporosarcina sp.]